MNLFYNLSSIGYAAFQNCTNLVSVTFPPSLRSIGDYGFNNTGLTSLSLNEGFATFGKYSFRSCGALKTVIIPNSVTALSIQVFQSCGNLTTVIIGTGITSIGNNCFVGCTKLTSLTIKATTPPTLGTTAIPNNTNLKIYVPATSIDSYKASWSSFANKIQAIQG